MKRMMSLLMKLNIDPIDSSRQRTRRASLGKEYVSQIDPLFNIFGSHIVRTYQTEEKRLLRRKKCIMKLLSKIG